MGKFLLITLSIAIIIIAFLTGSNLFEKIRSQLNSRTIASTSQILGAFTKSVKQNTTKHIQNTSKSVKTQTKSSIQEVVQDSTNSVVDFVETKTAGLLNSTFGNDTVTAVATTDLPTHSIDFLSDKNQQIVIRRGNKFILSVKNVPARFCLFISTTKFALNHNDNIAITLESAGSYPLRFDYCDTKQSQFGSIVVE